MRARVAVLAISGVALAAFAVPASRWFAHSDQAANLPAGVRTTHTLPGDEAKEAREGREEQGHAMEAMEWWYGTRAFPHAEIPPAAYYQAWQAAKALQPEAGSREASWNAIGPRNVAGRALSLAIDPTDPNILWCGTASGGLWKSINAGEGPSAWFLVDTGFPTLSVSSVIIQPNNRNVMYIGTGEMGRYGRGQVGTPGARDAYGLGVFKSTNAGVSWQTTGLTWTLDQSRVIFQLTMDRLNPSIVWAATSEGLYKTTDAGVSWTVSHSTLMAMDVVVDPRDSNKVWVSHGQLNNTPDPGIYRSTDGGSSWTLLGGGLPATDFGRTPLSIWTPSGAGAATLFAGVSNASTRQVVGLYKSTNDGTTWTRVSSTNWASSQAWYDNTIAVKPTDANTIVCAGLDVYRSTSGGSGLSQISNWFSGYEGEVPPGGPEGPSDYVHADAHAVVWSPHASQTVYIATDGGVFRSTNNGSAWEGKNGGMQTTQFYAGLAVSNLSGAQVLGGLQDNGTVLYRGFPTWSKVFGGDGGYCGIASDNPDLIYEEYVYLNVYRSPDMGGSWDEIIAGDSNDANFIAPFVVCQTPPNVVYAGGRSVKKSTNGGNSFFYPDGNSNWNGTPMAVIGVASTSSDTLLAATGSSATGAIFEMKRSTNGGSNWTVVSASLPNLFCTDISFHATNSRLVWSSFSGFGGPHLFKSTDAGLTWTNRTGDLPDIPVQSVILDPTMNGWVYAGTDLGVFRSTDDGATWQDFNVGMPDAMITDLVLVPGERLLRAATFGNGVYERLLAITTDVAELGGVTDRIQLSMSPNPSSNGTRITFALPKRGALDVSVYGAAGNLVRRLHHGEHAAGQVELGWDGRDERGERSAAGVYFIHATFDRDTRTAKLVVTR